MNTLLQDLALDLAAEAPPKWESKVRWTSGGYLARVATSIYECNSVSSTLIGVFHEELGSNGTRRLVARPLPEGGTHRLEIEELPSTAVCGVCIHKHGFTQEVPAPKTLTMQVGVGLLGTPRRQ